MHEEVRIGLTGDVMLGRNVNERQQHRPVSAVWGDLYDRLVSLDGLIINLECCLSQRGTPWTQTYRPFHFRADPDWAIPALESIGVDCCVLANNHLLDFGVTALEDTLNHLDTATIAHAGAGQTIDEAFTPATSSVENLDIAVVSLTDNTPEYGAREDRAGVAHLSIDPANDQTRDRVNTSLRRALADDPDLLIASLHWGPNMVEEPPAAFEQFARWLVDQGFDLIHGHSAHIFQGIEVVEGVPVLYDTGDFVDDYAVDSDLRNDRGFLFELGVDPTGTIEEVRLVPIEIYDCAVHHASQEAASWCEDRIRELSTPYGTGFTRESGELVVTV